MRSEHSNNMSASVIHTYFMYFYPPSLLEKMNGWHKKLALNPDFCNGEIIVKENKFKIKPLFVEPPIRDALIHALTELYFEQNE